MRATPPTIVKLVKPATVKEVRRLPYTDNDCKAVAGETSSDVNLFVYTFKVVRLVNPVTSKDVR